MPRIFCDSPIQLINSWSLPADTARHIQVLRLQPGDKFTLFNGRGGEFTSQILEMGRKEVVASVLSFNPVERELNAQIHLLMGMPANDKMDWIIEKATELGVRQVTPLMTQHNVVRLSGTRADKKTLHWSSIATAACTQCGRNTAPVIESPIELSNWLATELGSVSNPSFKWFFSLNSLARSIGPQIQELLKLPLNNNPHILIAFGPEGGWSSQEETTLINYGFTALSLGNRTLRAETAAIATLATLNLMLEQS
jgi:16S rRNA (uracil1498-N3)-methyltransferase